MQQHDDINKKAEELEKLVDDILSVSSGLIANIESRLENFYSKPQDHGAHHNNGSEPDEQEPSIDREDFTAGAGQS